MLTAISPQALWIAALAGVLLDAWLGEPKRWHPLVGFGKLANGIEAWLNPPEPPPAKMTMSRGAWAWGLLISLPTLITFGLTFLPGWAGVAWQALVLYLALGAHSLREHVMPISRALADGDLGTARVLTGHIVSRDTDDATAEELVRATVESTLENGNDAIFGALFWFAVAGAPGVVLFRLANTLDAMWGYRTPRFLYFGRPAARIDDALNWIPARLTAISYALLGDTRRAMQCWRTQAPAWPSPNAGPVMAAGAGALDVKLGGPARYDGEWEDRPPLGCDHAPAEKHIGAAWRLVSRALWLWLILGGALTMYAVSRAEAAA